MGVPDEWPSLARGQNPAYRPTGVFYFGRQGWYVDRMPAHVRFIGRYGNGLAALFFAFIVLSQSVEGGAVVIIVALCGLCLFNIYVIEKSARALAEEEWLKAEVRKAELRRQLQELDPADRNPPG